MASSGAAVVKMGKIMALGGKLVASGELNILLN